MPNIPESIATEIAEKRSQISEEQPTGDEPEKDEKPEDKKPKVDETKKDEPKKAEKPESKKGEAAKPKNGQSIAQVAEAATDDEDDEDEDDEDDSHDGDEHKSQKPRSSLFKEFIDTKKELKEMKRANKETSKQYAELATAMSDLIGVVKDLKGNKNAQRDEVEEFAEEWGLDKEGTKKLVGLLEKRLSTKLTPTKKESDDADDEDDEPKKSEKKPDAKKEALSVRKIELAIEGEYEDFLDSFPQLEKKINLKAIKRFIIGDEENLSKSFHDVVNDMYPGILAGQSAVDGGSNAGATGDDDEQTNFNDPKVLAQLDKNPKLKAKYHDDVLNRIKSIKR